MTHDHIHPKTPIEIAAQLWCLPQHKHKIMDPDLCVDIVKAISDEQRHTSAWYDTAAQHCRNEEYYRGLLIKIGETLGKEAYTSDDGSIQEDVLCAKVPEMVAALKAMAPKARAALSPETEA